MKNVLVISPHPDDEAIGCGGAICAHIADGDKVDVVFLTSGEKGGHGKTPEETSIVREKEASEAAGILQLSNIEFWRQPDGGVVVSDENISRLRDKINSIHANVIYVTHSDEEHPDHVAAANLVKQSLQHLSEGMEMPEVWMYEVWTPLQRMDHIVDISPYVDIKRQAILAHKCQCDVLKFHESALALNRYRGEMHSWPGGDYAEVFKSIQL